MSTVKLTSIILGAMGLPKLSQAACDRLIHCAIDHGITSFDTAPLYGAGESERMLGRALGGRRSRVQLLTKCGLRWDSDHGQPMFEMPVNGRMCRVRKDSRPAGIRESLETSLRDLGTDVIDVYQVHQYDAGTPVEDVMGELDRAQTAGKIRAIGISNYEVPELRRARASLPRGLFSTQSPFNLVQTRAAAGILAEAQTSGIAFLAYEPLAQGILAGKHLGGAGLERGPLRGIGEVNAMLRDVAAPAAREHGVTLAQIALAWLLAQPGATAAIAGASSEKQIAENAAAAALRLDASWLTRLDDAGRRCNLEAVQDESLLRRLRRRARRIKHGARRRLEAWLR